MQKKPSSHDDAGEAQDPRTREGSTRSPEFSQPAEIIKPTSKPTKPAKRKPPGKRKPGRPKASEKVVNPEVLETIARYWLKGYSLRQIGKAVGLHFTTVRDHLKRSIKPLWREAILDDLQADLNRMRMIEKRAWDKSDASKEPADLAMVKWAIEHRAKLAGHFAPQRVEVGGSSELRVAGRTPAEFDRETMRMLGEEIQRRAEYEEALRKAGEDGE